MIASLLTLVLAASNSLASPVHVQEHSLNRRLDTSSHCGQWATVAVGSAYILYLDQWGINGGTGSQCAHLTSFSGTTVSWATTWSWSGGTGIKSFSNIAAKTGLNKKLSAIKSIQTSWSWSQNKNNVVADVAYDLFTSATSGGYAAYEIMIWLANYNAGPISYKYGADGKAIPIATVTLASRKWSVYYGSNGYNAVYSFLPASGTTVTSFSADLKLFLTWLVDNHGLPSSQYLTIAEAGTEATSGSGVTLTTSAYSLVIS